MPSLLKHTLNTRWIQAKGQDTITLRSDTLDACDLEDIQKLESLGIQAIIDLRGSDKKGICPYLENSSLKYYQVSLDDVHFSLFQFIENTGAKTRDEQKIACGNFYYYSLKTLYVNQIIDVLKIYNQYDGHVLIHCSYGKDRTGMVAFLIQKYLGATEKEIEDDYVESAYNLACLNLTGFSLTTVADAKGILNRFYSLYKPEEQEILTPYLELLKSKTPYDQ